MSHLFDAKAPLWLNKSVDDVATTKEWNGFLGELQDAIQQQLVESHVQQFTDLSEAEKILFEEKGLRMLSGGETHQQLFHALSRATETNLNDQVSKEFELNSPYQTRSEAIHAGVVEGIVSLLYKWPDLKSQFVRFLNQSLPLGLRLHVWRVYFNNEYVLQQYHRILHSNPQQAISIDDYGISERCKQILSKEPSLKDMHGSTGAWYAMKAVLSYYHAMKSSQQRLTDSEILLIAPFLQVIQHRIARHEPPPTAVVEVLVQEYFTFMSGRPKFMVDTGHEENESALKHFTARVIALARQADAEIINVFAAALAPGREHGADFSDQDDDMYLAGAMMPLMKTLLKPFFVGILGMDALLFIWDQYVVSLDMPGLQEEFVAIAVACYFILMKAPLKAGANLAAFEKALKTEGLKLLARDFQYLINRFYFSDLYRLINFDKTAPILDPTQNPNTGRVDGGIQPNWRQWLVEEGRTDRVRSDEREHRRVQREADKQRIFGLEDELHRSEVKREAAEEALRIERERQAKEDAEELIRLRRDREYLDEQVRAEKLRRLEDQQRHEEEMRRLRMELRQGQEGVAGDASQRLGTAGWKRPATGESAAGELFLFPPPPSRATHYSPLPWYKKAQNAVHDLEPEAQALEMIVGMVEATAHAARKACHGSGAHTDVLNDVTRLGIVQHTDDMRDAERQVFGRVLREGELDEMEESDKRVFTDKMMQIIIRKTPTKPEDVKCYIHNGVENNNNNTDSINRKNLRDDVVTSSKDANSLGTLASRWASHTGMHGLPNITRTSNRYQRAAWTFLLLGGMAAMMWQIQVIVSRYISFPIQRDDADELQMPRAFPAVTLCNQKSWADRDKPPSSAGTLTGSVYSGLKARDRTMNSICDSTGMNYVFLDFYNALGTDWRSKIGFNITDFLIDCSFGGVYCDKQ
uniref:Rab-GAP TBC domain-containing protein n=1 Tax=Macrostomum lignano TaxID=282301 RepID=A0A1I8I062_9PLAT